MTDDARDTRDRLCSTSSNSWEMNLDDDDDDDDDDDNDDDDDDDNGGGGDDGVFLKASEIRGF